MSSSPLSDVVSNQYERWTYPEPILDLAQWLIHNWQWFDPSHAQAVLWPERAPRPDLDVLVAGCGTNQAAVMAYTNPQARIVAIDVSRASLDHHRHLKDRYGLQNLELHQLPIEEVEGLHRDFDLIISTGVLHHLADPQLGLSKLATVLRPDGVAAIMLYARYGRLGVEMMQGVFRDMGLGQTDASVLMVREALALLPKDHPVQSYIGIAPDLRFDAGLVDTFLHGRERSYTVADCIELVEGAGLSFQDFFLRAPYYPPSGSGNPVWQTISRLPVRQQWSAMERINFRNGCHFFLARHAAMSKARYAIDFASPDALSYLPMLRYRCNLNGAKLARHNWSMQLDPSEVALLQLADGRRSISEIVALAGLQTASVAVDFFHSLWRLDFLAVSLRPE